MVEKFPPHIPLHAGAHDMSAVGDVPGAERLDQVGEKEPGRDEREL